MHKLSGLVSHQRNEQTEAQLSHGATGSSGRGMASSTESAFARDLVVYSPRNYRPFGYQQKQVDQHHTFSGVQEEIADELHWKDSAEPSYLAFGSTHNVEYMKGTESPDSAHNSGPLLWNTPTSAGVSISLPHSSTTQIGPLYQSNVPPFRPLVVNFDLNVSCCSEAEVDGMDVDERLFGYGLPVPLMPKGGMMLQKDSGNAKRTHLLHQLKAEATSPERLRIGEDPSFSLPSSVKAEYQDVSDPLQSSIQIEDSLLHCKDPKSEKAWDNPFVDIVQRGPEHGISVSAQAGKVGCQVLKSSETARRKKRRKGSLRGLKKVKAKKQTSLPLSDQTTNEGYGYTSGFVPGIRSCTWNDSEAKAFTVALYLFGKNFDAVKRFFEHKAMQDILHFYYSQFYGTPAYRRWSRSRNSSKYCHGSSLVTGWRQEQLLNRLAPYLPDTDKGDIFQDVQRFNTGKLPMEHLVIRLKSVAGLENLVQAVGLGSGKHDLTIVPNDPPPARLELPPGKASSNLTTQEVIDFLTGDHRRSKARAKELFLAAVWPRLLARGWHSQETDGKLLYSKHRSKLMFLKPSHVYSRGQSVEGVDYFSSISEVLSLVAQHPDWLEPAETRGACHHPVGKKQVSARKEDSSISSDDELGTKGTKGVKQDPERFSFWTGDRRTWEAEGTLDYSKLLCGKSLTDPNVSSYRVFLSSRQMDWNGPGKNGQTNGVYEIIKLGYKASYSLLIRSLVSPRSLQRLEIPFVMTSSGWCPAVGSKGSRLCELLRKDCSMFSFPGSIRPSSVQSENLLEGDSAWTSGSLLVMKASGAWTWRLSTWTRQLCQGRADSNKWENVVDDVPGSGVGAFEPSRDSSTILCPESASSASCVTVKAEVPGDVKCSDTLKLDSTKTRSFQEFSCNSNACTPRPCRPKYASDCETVKTEPLSLDELGKVMVELKRGDQAFSAAYNNNFAESRRGRNRSVASLKPESSVACQSASSQAPVFCGSSLPLNSLKVEEFTSGVAESGQYKRRRQSSQSLQRSAEGTLEECEKPKKTFKRHPSDHMQLMVGLSQADFKRSSSTEKYSPKRCFQELDVRGEVLSKNGTEDLGSNWQGAAKKSKFAGSLSVELKDEDISPASQQLMLDFVYLLRSSFPVFPGQGLEEVHQVVAGEGVSAVKNKGKRSKRNRISKRESCWSSPLDMEDDLLGDGVSTSPAVQICQRVPVTKLRRRRRSMGLGSESQDSELTPPCMRSCTGTAFSSPPGKYLSSSDLFCRKKAGSSKHARVERSIELSSNTPVPDARFSSATKSPSAGKGGHIVATPDKASPLLHKVSQGRKRRFASSLHSAFI